MSTADQIWRDYATDGDPGSGQHEPLKSEIRIWGNQLDGVGAMDERPTTNLRAGQMYFDTNLQKPIWYDGTIWRLADGVAAAVGHAVTFDGSNDWISRGTDLDGNSDSTVVSGLLVFNCPTTNSQQLLFDSTSQRVRARLTVGNIFQIVLRSSAGTNLLVMQSSVQLNTGADHVVCWSFDNGTGQLYVDGTDRKSATTETAGTVDFTHADWGIGAIASTGADKFNGTMSRVTLWNDVALDCSDADVRAQMANPDQASTLGNNIIDFYGDAATWNAGTNQGTGGDFTMNGAVT